MSTEKTRRVAVVTGGAGAIGSAIAARLAADHTVVVLDRSGDVAVDLADPDEVRRAAQLVLERYGRCDVFVHCAGAFDATTLAEFDLATWRRVQAVNVEAALWLARAFTPGMADRKFGRIVFITSDTFWDPPVRPQNEAEPAPLPYIASKGALIGAMRKLARALGPDGISVTAVAPGLTETPGTMEKTAEFVDVVNRQALKRRLTPNDTAAAVAFLVSDDAAALTGQELCVDGGLVLR
ncbi:MAG TPA: SDR family oxidoreductase [Candidatus Dormibacteraeota bacterium]|nr:SDR family oxidoreductase [Candidatus Dormibacteraeota bacterium]